MARMRLLKEALNEIKSSDPSTAITANALRGMAKRGEIQTVMVGNKYLINMDLLESYLSNPKPLFPDTSSQTGIRRISEKL